MRGTAVLPFESCNLGSINLANMVKITDKGIEVDWPKLKYTTWKAVHFLDNVIDVNKYPLAEIDKNTKANRKDRTWCHGMGRHAYTARIPYSSDRHKTCRRSDGFMQTEAVLLPAPLPRSAEYFPTTPRASSRRDDIRMLRYDIAPTGTLSIIGLFIGHRPLFAVSYVRTVMEGTKPSRPIPCLSARR